MTQEKLLETVFEILANQLSQNLGSKLTEALATGLLQVTERRLKEIVPTTE